MGALATREKLRSAALALFVEQGVAETTTRDLAAKAGIAEGTIYRHYQSKDDLVRDLFQGHYVEFGRALDRIQSETPGTVDAKLRAMIDYMCGLFDEDPTLYRFLLLAQHTALPNIRTQPSSPLTIFSRLIQQAVARGELPEQDVTLAAAMTLGAIIQPALAVVYGTLGGTMRDLAPSIALGCRALLRAPRAGAA